LRRFEFVGGSSSKFWEISQSDTQVTVRFGRIGTNGQTQTKDHESWEDAAERVRKLVAEKLREGYQEVASSGPRPETEPGFRTPPALPPYEVPPLPSDGPVTLGRVSLPPGHRLAGSSEFAPMGVAPVTEPVIWATDDLVEDAGRIVYLIRQPAAARNLVPVLLAGMESETNRPWDSHEFCPTDPRRAVLIDVEAELAKSWRGHFEDDDEFASERLASVRPFGKTFPGMARPASLDRITEDSDVLAQMRGRRIGLIAAPRPADVLAAVGWCGAVNIYEDPALLSAVLRSWEIRWNAYLVEIGFDTLTLTVGNPPQDDKSALALAAEHCAFCPDNIWQGSETIAAYARDLAGSPTWQFWFD
jgi:predicted DNA-binding WGR domain protein